jgi:hypothetical protein
MKSPKEIQDAFINEQGRKWTSSVGRSGNHWNKKFESFEMILPVGLKNHYSKREFRDIHNKSIIHQEKEKQEFKKWAIAAAAV